MSRFDNYIEEKNAIESEKLSKEETEKKEREQLWEERKKTYLPVIKEKLTEFTDVLPRIKKWASMRCFVEKRILGIKSIKEKPVTVIELVGLNYYSRDDSYWPGIYIGKDGKYYKKRPYAGVTEIDIDEMTSEIFKNLPWEPIDYVKRYPNALDRSDEIANEILAGNVEEAVYKYFEKCLERRI